MTLMRGLFQHSKFRYLDLLATLPLSIIMNLLQFVSASLQFGQTQTANFFTQRSRRRRSALARIIATDKLGG